MFLVSIISIFVLIFLIYKVYLLEKELNNFLKKVGGENGKKLHKL